ncbi:MAG: glutamate 5-kinase, partial [Candidatus Binataceae bacterium]
MSHLSLKAEILARTRRLVVKVGSAVLSDADGLKTGIIGSLAAQVDGTMRGGREVVLVTSGAIAAGRARFGKVRGTTIAARQAAAAVGQIELMAAWARSFNELGRPAAQILLTHQDLAEQRRRNNARNTIHTLLAAGIVPIINENDTVAVDEIRFGDNDMLSSLAASLVQAELLVIMTDVAGVLTGDPRKRSGARLIPLITNPDAPMRGLIAESAGPLGSGGMAGKFKAARQASRAGIAVVITAGDGLTSLADVLDPAREAGTLIIPARGRLKGHKHWIAFALRPAGALMVDRGASEALRA